MREIEVKVRLSDVAAVRSQLEDLGCSWSAPIAQSDRVFFARGDDPLKAKTGRVVLRIREEAGSIKLGAKKHLSGELDCIEHEIAISASREATSIIEMLGFVETVSVLKSRQQSNCFGFNFCLDVVEGLGEFLEVEALVVENGGNDVQSNIAKLLERIGLNSSEHVTIGYDTLLLRSRHEGKQTTAN